MLNDSELKLFKHFIKFAAKELGLTNTPNIVLTGRGQDKHLAFGHSIGKDITVRVTGRHPMDSMRTIAHEMYHVKLHNKSSTQSEEDKANAMAGRIMKKYNTLFPNVFKHLPIREETVIGDSSPSNPNSPIAQPERLLSPKILKRKKLRDIVKVKK